MSLVLNSPMGAGLDVVVDVRSLDGGGLSAVGEELCLYVGESVGPSSFGGAVRREFSVASVGSL